jgi:DNA-binding MarR family transcriptional regulator
MSFLYNPDRMTEQEVRDTFVARTTLIDALLGLIERQPEGAGVQHAIVTGPRGMGKTTVLLMVQFRMGELGLSQKWQPIKFPEESYSIGDLADLWLEALGLLVAESGDRELESQLDALRGKESSGDDLGEKAWAVLKDWSTSRKKRLLFLIDNFDMIIEQIGDEKEKSRLRDILMNDGTAMFIGTAVSFFKESTYDKPFYHFFRLFDLKGLNHHDVVALLKRRADIDGIKDFEKMLAESRGKFLALEYFTGGNPRIILMLYRVVTEWSSAEVKKSLEKLLDEVTPFYKAKTEVLPPQQRKILDHIARESAESFEGLSPSAIASSTRMKPNIVSMQLKRLSEAGYVRSANIKGRSSCFTLSEPLYAIWYQMRFSRSARERMLWLVSFLKVWFELPQLVEEVKSIKNKGEESCKVKEPQKALYSSKHGLNIPEAMPEGPTPMSVIMKTLLTDISSYGFHDVLDYLVNTRLNKELFPFVRAIEYLESGNEDLIEKLSPEYRKIVTDIAKALKERMK